VKPRKSFADFELTMCHEGNIREKETQAHLNDVFNLKRNNSE
jgi:hypothetical protein